MSRQDEEHQQQEHYYRQQHSEDKRVDHAMEESTMLQIMGQQHSSSDGDVTGRARPLPVPSQPNQVVQERTVHHQVRTKIRLLKSK